MEIAVVGGGIAGLSATWFLGRRHHVTLYERAHRPGLDANTVEVECAQGDRVQINAPMRVFFPAYYPTLTALLRELDVASVPVEYSGSFSEYGADAYFRYRNHRIGNRSIPFLAGRSLFASAALRLGAELLWFLKRSKQDLRNGKVGTRTLPEYLDYAGVSGQLAHRFLYPVFAGICTCSYQALREYPAAILLEYLHSGLLGSPVRRLENGTAGLATQLSSAAHSVQCNTRLQDVRPKADGVQVTDSEGRTNQYDHVVFATQANQALELLNANELQTERDILRAFRYEGSRLVVHTDPGLIPARKSEWAPVNFFLSDFHDRPMASILMNRIHPQLRGHRPILETWNPYREIPDEQVLLDAVVDRPLVSQCSLAALKELEALHQGPGRRLWFCGSYAHRGIPLLESAVASARSVSDLLQGATAAVENPVDGDSVFVGAPQVA